MRLEEEVAEWERLGDERQQSVNQLYFAARPPVKS